MPFEYGVAFYECCLMRPEMRESIEAWRLHHRIGQELGKTDEYHYDLQQKIGHSEWLTLTRGVERERVRKYVQHFQRYIPNIGYEGCDFREIQWGMSSYPDDRDWDFEEMYRRWLDRSKNKFSDPTSKYFI